MYLFKHNILPRMARHGNMTGPRLAKDNFKNNGFDKFLTTKHSENDI